MPPKRTSTSEAPAMTQAAIRKLVADSVATALEAQAATMANADNTNRNTGEREAPVARKCSYKEFMSCQPINFKGTEGFGGMKSSFPIATVSKTARFVSLQFLGYLIDSQGLHVDPTKIEAKFIKDFSKIAKSLIELTQKNKKYIWDEDQESAFQLLKQKLCEALILALLEGMTVFRCYCYSIPIRLGRSYYDCEIRYHLGKANVIADALSQKEQIKPL
ncbi:hypothetical protein Tco_0796151 [Tanacetum coccineum]